MFKGVFWTSRKMDTPFLEPTYSSLGQIIAVSFSMTPVAENSLWQFQKQPEGLPRLATTQKIWCPKATSSSKLYGSNSSMKKLEKLKQRRPLSKDRHFLLFKRVMNCRAFSSKIVILGLGWFRLVWVDLGWFRLIWVGLG